MTYLILTIVFFAVILIYFRIADHYNIIDHPNERSSHSEITIRGGGIVFLFASVAAMILYPQYWLPLSAIFVIGSISFLDDRITLSNKIRLLFHLIAVTMLFLFLNVFSTFPLYITFILYIFVIGTVNAYNFMDGINGITGLYSSVILLGLQYVNLYKTKFIDADLIWIPITACCVFLFFNFRKKAKCFAGDVGSVTIAFWIVMLLFKLIFLTNDWEYVLFLVVYGIDSSLTIMHRLILKQNIFKAHRLHFYQLLANEHKISHLIVSGGYAIIQSIIILLIIFNRSLSISVMFGLTIIPLAVIYITVKPHLMEKLNFNL
jgi:UDP-N-acetylmuramyl pentapeptide phosphotransferase/UDP-N-acetylglucosamine-1-phosphate transferase